MRRSALAALLLLAACGRNPGRDGASHGLGRPNVLFIAADDLRVETEGRTPGLDALAARSLVFERAYCQQAVCNPSRASLLTGLRPSTLGVWDLATHFRKHAPDVVTLPEHFRRNGYLTRNVGKIFHNWHQDAHRGDPASWSVPAELHYGRHQDDVARVEGAPPPELAQTPRCEMRDVPDEAYLDGRVAARAVEALRELKEAGRPWFLAVGFWKPHADFNAPKRYWDLYERDRIAMPANPDPPADVPPIALHDGREIRRGFPAGGPTPGQTRTLRHGYLAALSFVDAQLGKLIGALDRLGLAGDTIVVFWSDHGFHLGEHGLWAKTSNFELDARVPLMLAAPGYPGGRRTRALVELLDLYPTLADLAGLPRPARAEGMSLRPILEDPAREHKPAAFTWHPRPAYPKEGADPEAMGYSMRTERWRYTEWRAFATGVVLARELYDHARDPHETRNLAARPEHRGAVAELEALLGRTHPRGPVFRGR